MEFVDLRSDTVTQPTPAMREAMAKATVGDDVYGEDPTINRLQEMAAVITGKQAGLFVPSGTMGNLAAVLTHCNRGDEVILGNMSHSFLYEAGGVSALGGVHSCQVPNQPDGSMLLEDIRAAVRKDDIHAPVTRLIILENTHNRCGGAVLSLEYTRQVGQLAIQRGLSLHLDGARIFNASVALGVSVAELVGPADSITFCLSKALCAPVGSVLCGSQDFIKRAKRLRKQLGGGMRQAGVLAAAGIVALETMVDRLAEDHLRAKRLAHQLAKIPGLTLEPGSPCTNMVYLKLAEDIPAQLSYSDIILTAGQVAENLKAYGVLVGVVGERRFRLVTHYWISDEDVNRVVAAFRQVLIKVLP